MKDACVIVGSIANGMIISHGVSERNWYFVILGSIVFIASLVNSHLTYKWFNAQLKDIQQRINKLKQH